MNAYPNYDESSLKSKNYKHHKKHCNNHNNCGYPMIVSSLPSDAIPLYSSSSSSGKSHNKHYVTDSFKAMVTPLVDLQPTYDPNNDSKGLVEFKMRRKNNVVNLQWEPFSGCITQNGIGFLSVQQSISNLPKYMINIPVVIQLKGVNKSTYLVVDPFASIQLKIYLDVTGSGSGINSGDTVTVYGSCVSWIV